MDQLLIHEAAQPSCGVVALKTAQSAQPVASTAQPHQVDCHQADSRQPALVTPENQVALIPVPEAAILAGCSEQAIRKAIKGKRLDATTETVLEGRHKGRDRHAVHLESLFAYAPAAREAWERQQAQASAQLQTRTATTPATRVPHIKRDPQQVVLRANPDALHRAQAVQHARLSYLDQAIRPRLASLNEFERHSCRNGVPSYVLDEAQQWLRTSPEGQAILKVLKSAPSDTTLRRWWGLYAADPTGDSLKPNHSACGRPRRTDQAPGLEDEIRGAYAHAGSFAGAAEVLRQKGIPVSEATVRRRLNEMDPAILVGLRMGTRKALTDHGPFVRRRPSLPFQCWSIDGHTLDCLVLWDDPLPGEKLEPFRPQLYAVWDVGSGAFLGWQLGHGLNRYLPMMAIADAILRFGVIPDAIQPDNGSEVRNRLFEGDEDILGYFSQLGMDWKEDQALARHALPYNSRSKPIERAFRTLTEGFTARLPAYVGGNPSARPGGPLATAKAEGNFETITSLRTRLSAWMAEKIQQEHTVQRHRITPVLALQEQRERLVLELGATHPRFLRPGQEWRVLPGLKARLIRGFVCCRIEGQDLRFNSSLLDGLDADALSVRINPWDVSQAWLCRGGELLDTLTYVPDGPELGAGATDVVALRIAKNIERRQKGILKQAEVLQERNRREAGMLTGHRAKEVFSEPREVAEISDLTAEQLALASEMKVQLGLKAHAPAASPSSSAPAKAGDRSHIKSDLDWAVFVIRHPDHCDEEEVRELNHRLRTDTNLRLWLQQELGEIPNPIPLFKEA